MVDMTWLCTRDTAGTGWLSVHVLTVGLLHFQDALSLSQKLNMHCQHCRRKLSSLARMHGSIELGEGRVATPSVNVDVDDQISR